MKLVTFRTDRRDRGGILVGDVDSDAAHVVDLAHGFTWLEQAAGRPSDPAHVFDRYGAGVLGFVENAEHARPAAERLVELWRAGRLPPVFDGLVVVHAAAEVTFQAPLPRPTSLRDGYAFRQHVEAARRQRGLPMPPEFDEFPVFYFGNARSVVGPGDVTVQPEHLERLDYELEAAVVVGKTCRNLCPADADAAIFGMMIMNDWSARALQSREMKLNLGPAKGKDFATSLGPWLVTIDELESRSRRTPDGLVFDLEMRASINGHPLSRGNLCDMRWTFAQILARASQGADLVAGDVVGSGTCGTGCLLELNGASPPAAQSQIEPEDGSVRAGWRDEGDDRGRWLAVGDVVTLEIERLGKLENRVALAIGR